MDPLNPDHSNAARDGAAIARTRALPIALRRVLGGESLSPAPSREARPEEVSALDGYLRAELTEVAHALARAGAAARAASPQERILRIIKASSTARGRVRFDDPLAMAGLTQTIDEFVRRGATITFFLPLGGQKAPNAMKTGFYYLSDTTEDLMLVYLAALAMAVGSVYSPGARVLVMPDAPLHTGDLGFPQDQYEAHARLLHDRIDALGLRPYVTILDTVGHLPMTWAEEVRANMNRTRDELRSGNQLLRARVGDQVQTLRFSINTRDYAWSYEHQVLVASALAGLRDVPAAASRDAQEVQHRTELVTPHYVGVNIALRTLKMGEIVSNALTGSPLHVRLTVHAKPGEPRPMLTQSNSRARPMLLPMHGLPLRFANERGLHRFAGVFHLEAVLEGWTPVVRSRDGGLLYYEQVALDGDLVTATRAA